MVLQDGDRIYVGYGQVLDEFNAETAGRAVERTPIALRQLKENFSYEGFPWLDGDLSERW